MYQRGDSADTDEPLKVDSHGELLTRAEADTEEQGYSGNEGRAELETPCNVSCTVQNQVGGETEEDAKGSLSEGVRLMSFTLDSTTITCPELP